MTAELHHTSDLVTLNVINNRLTGVVKDMGACGMQKKFISKEGIFMILRKEENSQPTIKPNFI